MSQKQLMRRYMRELLVAMFIYIVVLISSISVLERTSLPQVWQVVITLLPAIPVAFVILAILRLLLDSDELQQRIQLSATAFSAALTGFITFSYGFLENVGFPKFSTFLVFPMLILIWGISLGYFSRRYQ